MYQFLIIAYLFNLYVNNLVGDIKANPRDFYRYINSQKKTIKVFRPLKEEEELVSRFTASAFHKLLSIYVFSYSPFGFEGRMINGYLFTSEIEQAEEFNRQFTDVFNNSDHSEVPFLSRSTPFIDNIVFVFQMRV